MELGEGATLGAGVQGPHLGVKLFGVRRAHVGENIAAAGNDALSNLLSHDFPFPSCYAGILLRVCWGSLYAPTVECAAIHHLEAAWCRGVDCRDDSGHVFADDRHLNGGKRHHSQSPHG